MFPLQWNILIRKEVPLEGFQHLGPGLGCQKSGEIGSFDWKSVVIERKWQIREQSSVIGVFIFVYVRSTFFVGEYQNNFVPRVD